MQFMKRVYIGIFFTKKGSLIGVKVEKNGKVYEHYTKEFLSIEHTLSREAISLISSLADKYPYTYVGTVAGGQEQGALPWCEGKTPPPRDALSVCVEGKYRLYMDPLELRETKKRCEDAGGVDFVFSPVTLISSLLKREQSDEVTGGILLGDGLMTLAIFDRDVLLFWASAPTDIDKDEEVAEQETEDFLDNVGDFEENMDEIVSDDLEFDLEKEIEDADAQATEEFSVPVGGTNDFEVFAHMVTTFIQTSFLTYYHDAQYDEKFVEQISIFGAPEEMEGWLQERIEHDMLIPTKCASVDMAKSIVELVKDEVLS